MATTTDILSPVSIRTFTQRFEISILILFLFVMAAEIIATSLLGWEGLNGTTNLVTFLID